ncbi:Hypothetical protein R9X50_00677200 [Acrodontium crateriforme]|uniref:DUF7907 domain-containing protein n=1 Tax=Acrodontium crateriforme TaxID=150365 RepID=A0AAQ3M912_9PEZI|nr:Hypothetical protein R9X50_00677200 [Acrodontium crateriforme]
MHFVTAILSGSALLAGLAAAQTVQSKPFNLIVENAQNKSINGLGFASCHEGAAIESLCLGYDKATFYLNTTQGGQSGVTGDGVPGVLNWNLKGSNFVESEGMSFFVDPSTNVALPLFEPAYQSQYVAFDGKDLMNIQSYLDDTKSPPNSEQARALYRWYVCNSNFEGYVYQTLNWVLGNGKPQNPSCQKVDIKRVFI